MLTGLEIRERVEARIAELPTGYISEKNINGKKQYYLQWREDGKLKSKYIRAGDLEDIRKQIAERKELEDRLKDMIIRYPKEGEAVVYETNVHIGKKLKNFIKTVEGYQKRDCFDKIQEFLKSSDRTRVCALYGLRRTGKSTLLLQCIENMSDEDFQKTAYIKVNSNHTMDKVTNDLNKLFEAGYRYVFIDEVTLMKDFVDSAALFSDIYAMMGMKIVLSGTDSLGFWFAQDRELYDRVRMIHTTFIPFREFSRLLGIDSIDEYIRYGGTLRLGEQNLDDPDANRKDASFRDDESTRKYLDTAICDNIQKSLMYAEDGRYFGKLYELYAADELSSAINRIIEDMHHRFLEEVIKRDFVSSDLGTAKSNLKREKNPEKKSDALININREKVTEQMMKLVGIINEKEQTIEVRPTHLNQIKLYLKGLELIEECPIRVAERGIEADERIIFTQPGMRYCLAQALVHSLMSDAVFTQYPEKEKNYVIERILQGVRGKMLEDIILLETSKALGRKYQVFKFLYKDGEFDMVIRDDEEDKFAIYEIKHSKECVREQARHLLNEDKIKLATYRFGILEGRYVLYLGEDLDTEDGIAYRNAETFLKNLPNISLVSGLEETQSEDETQGFIQNM